MEKTKKKEEITLRSATDDVIGGLLVGSGGIGAATLMKVANSKLKLHPMLVALLTLALGFALRISSNLVANEKIKSSIKDLSSGAIAVGSVDSTIKLLDMVYPAWRDMLPDALKASLPASLGGAPRAMNYGVPTNVQLGIQGPGVDSNLLNGAAQDAQYQVISSNILG